MPNALTRTMLNDFLLNASFSLLNSLISACSIWNDLTIRMPENIWCIDSVTSPNLAKLVLRACLMRFPKNSTGSAINGIKTNTINVSCQSSININANAINIVSGCWMISPKRKLTELWMILMSLVSRESRSPVFLSLKKRRDMVSRWAHRRLRISIIIFNETSPCK